MSRIYATQDGIVCVSVESRFRDLAACIANTYVDELDWFLRSSNMSHGKSARLFLERKLADIESELRTAQDSLRSYQEVHRVTVIDEETKAAIDAYARLRAQLYARESELRSISGVASEENPTVAGLGRDVAALREQLAEIESGGGGGFGAGFGVPLVELPSVAAGYAVRYRDYRVLEEAYSVLYEQYQYAQVAEARDTPALTLLSSAVPPDRRSSPKRTLIVVLVSLVSLVVGLANAFVLERFEQMRLQDPEQYSEWAKLRRDAGAAIARLSVPGRTSRHR